MSKKKKVTSEKLKKKGKEITTFPKKGKKDAKTS
jgi:hypothetical protein